MKNYINYLVVALIILCGHGLLNQVQAKTTTFEIAGQEIEIERLSIRFINDQMVCKIEGSGWVATPIEDLPEEIISKAWVIYQTEENNAWNGGMDADEWVRQQGEAYAYLLWR
ncbi:hypothetical protein [Persicobacter diffluens]|uniref:Uncharacterized protein n=1 Tax=Persicobacter diffluens TaxID=981 RepID=A0AAN4W3X7_9BACT|nr:hypothetical protein PEDI_43940 [Persicobacter diffluens]